LAVNLFVDPIDLRMSSDHLAVYHDELLAAHRAADSVMAEAQGRWVGASASAIDRGLARWREDTDTLTAAIATQESAIRCAADEYTRTDTEGAAAVRGRR
jgi:WXG100 family type VII secretion target